MRISAEARDIEEVDKAEEGGLSKMKPSVRD